MTTYNRKYYLHRRIKKAGFALKLEKTSHTILINPDLSTKAKQDKYVQELQKKHQYGVQLLNPLWL